MILIRFFVLVFWMVLTGCSSVLGLGEDDLDNSGFLASFAPVAKFRWDVSLLDPDSSETAVNPLALTIDSTDSAIVCGNYEHGQLNLGSAPLPRAKESANILVAKYDANGQHLWSKGIVRGSCLAVALDSSDNPVITGFFEGQQADFGGGPLANAGGRDIFLVKLDPQGNHLFSQSFGTPDDEYGDAVALDAGDQILLATSGPETLAFDDTPVGGTCHLIRLDAAAEHLWSRGFDTICSNLSLSLNDAGEILLGGSYVGDQIADFGGGPLEEGSNIFGVRFDSQGNHQWSKGFYEDPDVYTPTFLQDGQKYFYRSGSELCKHNASGRQLWRTYFVRDVDDNGKENSDVRIQDIALDPSGDVVITGSLHGGRISLGGPEYPAYDGKFVGAFLARYTSKGHYLWSMIFGGPVGRAVALDSNSNVIFAGGKK